MASVISALTSGGGGISMTGDASGILNLNSNGTTVVAVTSAGVAVTGTLSATGAVTLTTALPVLQGGTGVTTSTGTGAGVHSVGPSISSAVMTTMASSVITSGTAVASTSGTSIDFTSIPSWVKKITVMFASVSTNGSSVLLIQIGTSGGITTSGYLGSGFGGVDGAVGAATYTTGFGIGKESAAARVNHGSMLITNLTSNTWSASGVFGTSNEARIGLSGGSIALGGALDRVRITTVNGTDAFDAGSINILFE
jgi:hypothetical protein